MDNNAKYLVTVRVASHGNNYDFPSGKFPVCVPYVRPAGSQEIGKLTTWATAWFLLWSVAFIISQLF
jgi:hypothetical protein